MKPTRIVVDSTSRILYSAFYIKGLYEVFGRENVSFGRKYFKDLKREKEQYSFEHFFAFVSICEKKTTRFVIDFCDPPDISREAYDWCDVYAKINYNKDTCNLYKNKLIVIPPSFGIKIWNFRQTFVYCIKNILSSPFSLPTKSNTFLKDYYQQYKREPLENYLLNPVMKSENENPYIFMIGTLWNENDYAESTNEERKNFMEACRKIDNCKFEGGFYAIPNHLKYEEFKNFIFSTPYSTAEYINKTKLSDIVFNTPAVHNCHGWKLPEFLAMGKPIISTKLSNELPINLSHGNNIHIAASKDEIQSSIKTILDDHKYKELLSKNAKDYFLKYMTPSVVINRVIGEATKTK